MGGLTPVVKGLLLINVAVFLVDNLLLGEWLTQFGAFSIRSAILGGRVWEFVTFQFLHGGVLHLLMNSIGLFFFGPWMERWWGARRFVVFYLLCGVAGAAFFSLLTWVGALDTSIRTGLVGASAGIYGILAGVAVIAPNLRVALLFPPIELSMRQLALAMLVIAVASIVFGLGGNAGGEAGHLGGALLGLLLVKRPDWLAWVDRRGPGVEIIRPKAFSYRGEAKLRPRTKLDLTRDDEVDRILDKISREGFQSLTEGERETLYRSSKDNQR